METVLGICGPDFVMVAADTTLANSIVVNEENVNKIQKVGRNLMIATVGDPGDAVQFTEFISRNIALYKMRHGYDLSPNSVAHFTRRHLAESLRTRKPYKVNLMLAGIDMKEGPELQFLDYLGDAVDVNYGGHGYGSMFCEGIFDRYYKPDLTEDEAYNILEKCALEIQKRLILNIKKFHVSVVDEDGIRDLDEIVYTNLSAESQ